jgi:hypothetical protein
MIIYNGLIFILEFKINELMYRGSDMDQCLDYALDLKYVHKESHKEITKKARFHEEILYS